MPVVEIEMIINKLTALVSSASSSNAKKLTKLVQKWNTVLSNYRSYNTDLTAMFTAEALQFVEAVNHFKAFQSG